MQASRMTWATETYLATYDSVAEETSRFDNYDAAARVNLPLFNHTDCADCAYSQQLTGQAGSVIGLAKSLRVHAGDTVTMEAFGKYYEPAPTGILGQIGSAFIDAFQVPVLFEGMPLQDHFNGLFAGGSWFHDDTDDDDVTAYLNYLLFDDDYNLVSFGFSSLTDAAAEDGTDEPHEKLALDVAVVDAGYLYMYLSNESPMVSEVYFDDFKITHKKRVIDRSDQVAYRYGFGGVEKDDEIAGAGNSLSFLFRNYDPRLGRFKSVDPLAPQYPFYNPYHFAGNSPIAFIDLEGLEPSYFATKNNDGETKLTVPVIGLLAELYGQPYWMAGAKANIKINQKLHDNLTGYKSGAITLGFDINYTQNYENASGASWLLLTSHEIVHVDQFIGMFGKDFENNEQYQEAVGGWVVAYGLDAAATWLDNPGGSQHELHDGIDVEKGANQNEKLFENFFNAQNYRREDGSYGNKVIDLLKQADEAQQNEDKDGYRAAYDSLINLAKEYKASLESEEE